MGEGGSEKKGEIKRFPKEEVVTSLSQRLRLLHSTAQRRLREAEVPVDEMKSLAEAFVEYTDDSEPRLLRDAEIIRKDFVRSHTPEALDEALGNLMPVHLENTPYCRGVALAFLNTRKNPQE